MDKRAMANQLIADFGKMLTLESLSLDSDTNSCILIFDDELVLNIEYDDPEERLVFSIYLDEIPEEGAEPLLRELMGANLYWHQTRGATLCLEEGTGGIILAYPRSVSELDATSIETIAENLLNLAEKWRDKIKSFTSAAQTPSVETVHPPLYG